MSKAKWDICPLIGISKKALGRSDYANNQGEFNHDKYPLSDCDLLDVRSIAHAAGYSRVDNFLRAVEKDMETNPSSPAIHLHRLEGDNEKTLIYATHTTSAEWGGKNLRRVGEERQKTGKKITDVSGGSATDISDAPPPRKRW
jgi:hypothetical protein